MESDPRSDGSTQRSSRAHLINLRDALAPQEFGQLRLLVTSGRADVIVRRAIRTGEIAVDGLRRLHAFVETSDLEMRQRLLRRLRGIERDALAAIAKLEASSAAESQTSLSTALRMRRTMTYHEIEQRLRRVASEFRIAAHPRAEKEPPGDDG